MTQNEYETLMTAVLDIGKKMLVSGAEVYRVEDTITRILLAYGATDRQVTAVPSHIIATACFEGREYTLSRRIEPGDYDLEKVDRLNALSRTICREVPNPSVLKDRITEAEGRYDRTKLFSACVYAFISGAFAMFFGGGALDALAGMLVGGTLFYVRKFISRTGGNRVFVALLGSAYTAFMAKVLVYAGLGHDADKVVIGVVMVLIPGIELLNGFRDFIAGDIQAGIMHLSEAVFLGVVIAMGAAGMFTLAGRLGM